MSKRTEIRRDNAGRVVGVSEELDGGSTRRFNSNPAGHYTEHKDGSAWTTGSDGKATRVGDGGSSGNTSGNSGK